MLRDKLVETYDGAASAYELLEEMGSPLFDSYDDGSALIELLSQLYDFPSLAVEVGLLNLQIHLNLQVFVCLSTADLYLLYEIYRTLFIELVYV